jgi:hypothetical protein
MASSPTNDGTHAGGIQQQPNFKEMFRVLQTYKMQPEEERIAKRGIRQLTYSTALGFAGGIAIASYLAKIRGFTGGKKVGAYLGFMLLGSYTGSTIGLSLAVPTLRSLEQQPIWEVLRAALNTQQGMTSAETPGSLSSGSTSDYGSPGWPQQAAMKPAPQLGRPASAFPPSAFGNPSSFPAEGQEQQNTPQAQPVKLNKYGDRIE